MHKGNVCQPDSASEPWQIICPHPGTESLSAVLWNPSILQYVEACPSYSTAALKWSFHFHISTTVYYSLKEKSKCDHRSTGICVCACDYFHWNAAVRAISVLTFTPAFFFFLLTVCYALLSRGRTTTSTHVADHGDGWHTAWKQELLGRNTPPAACAESTGPTVGAGNGGQHQGHRVYATGGYKFSIFREKNCPTSLSCSAVRARGWIN